ncbi:variable surface protein [Plasmodium gonderi]|uniref:Variable surface protein n=1 Tax=Plasmodium gonderi TaxID=77519 RepID=A0A1Y1JTJ2_PLAGO|nr:variable surface protein [Plasmodium gonderi]GAW84447.1 variable surface protein [Plasmodium gonderi]
MCFNFYKIYIHSHIFHCSIEYKFVGDFPELQKIMNKEKGEGESVSTGNCRDIESNVPVSFNSTIVTICKKVLDYIETIQTDHRQNFIESRCIYFYYWLYDMYGENKDIKDIKFVYQFMVKQFNNDYGVQCMNYEHITITNNEMLNLKVLYDMYAKLNCISKKTELSDNECECAQICADKYMEHKQTCKYNTLPYFCNTLEEFKNKYNKQMSSSKCNNGSPKTLPSLQSNNVITLTVIPVVVTLAISSFLFILYKVNYYFIPYGRSIGYEFMNKRKKYNNIDKELNISQQYEISSFNLRNKGYHILYNFH